MGREFMDMDANGIATYAHFNHDGDVEAFEFEDDVESILEANLQSRNDGSGGYGASREWKLQYRIPFALCYQWEKERGLPVGFLQTKEGFELLLKIAKDPDYGKLRADK